MDCVCAHTQGLTRARDALNGGKKGRKWIDLVCLLSWTCRARLGPWSLPESTVPLLNVHGPSGPQFWEDQLLPGNLKGKVSPPPQITQPCLPWP